MMLGQWWRLGGGRLGVLFELHSEHDAGKDKKEQNVGLLKQEAKKSEFYSHFSV